MNGKNSKFNNSPRVQERDLKERASTYPYSRPLINCVTTRTVKGKKNNNNKINIKLHACNIWGS